MDGRFISHTLPDSDRLRRHYLLLGICGSGLRALAEILLDAGHRVTGTDRQLGAPSDVFRERLQWPDPLVSSVQQPELITWSAAIDLLTDERNSVDCVVASAAVPTADERLLTARRLGLKTHLLTEALAERFHDHRQICVAGTHGKSTTTGLLWWVLNDAGLRPAGFVGGQLINNSRSGFSGGRSPAAVSFSGASAERLDSERLDSLRMDGATLSIHPLSRPIAVMESCEYRRAFHVFTPSIAVLTGIERDHFDCFPTADQEDDAFREFLGRLTAAGRLIVNRDCFRGAAIASSLVHSHQLTTIGLGKTGDVATGVSESVHWSVRHLSMTNAGTTFDAVVRTGSENDEQTISVTLQIPGLHNVRNALCAIAAAWDLGVSGQQISEAVATYRGIRRRFERRGFWNGMELIDDYAHHPGAIQATLAASRLSFPGRRLIAVFEPHQLSRTTQLFDEFRDALTRADEVLLLPVLAAREQATGATCCRTSGKLVREVNSAGGRAFLVANLDQAIARIDHSGRPGDVVITMGAGRTNQIHDEFNRRLQRDFVA